MQQRQLRLGDIVDDYCPRERRVTNHAIVAMVEQDVKQTRCTTCDTEHEYKQAKVPPQRKKKAAPGALYQEVLAGMPRKPSASGSEPSAKSLSAKTRKPPHRRPRRTIEPELAAGASEPVDDVEGPVHRPLIRATLPRPEGQVPTRQAPEFTIRQPLARPGRFRQGGGGTQADAALRIGANGGGFEFGGRRNGASAGGPHGTAIARPGHGDQQGPPQHRRRGGKKRSNSARASSSVPRRVAVLGHDRASARAPHMTPSGSLENRRTCASRRDTCVGVNSRRGRRSRNRRGHMTVEPIYPQDVEAT